MQSTFNDVWDDTHHDNTHLEPRFHTTTDAKGNVSTYMTMETVYDDTTHTYTYYPAIGESASRSANELVSAMLHLGNEQLIPVKNIKKENRNAIIESRKARDENYNPHEKEIRDIAANWARGATYSVNISDIHSHYSAIVDNALAWNQLKNTSQSAQYKTTSHSDAGPEGFQTCESILDNCNKIVPKCRAIQSSIASTLSDIPKLERKIYEFAYMPAEKLRGKEGERAAEDIIRSATDIYSTNFKRGFDVSTSRPWMVALYILAGTLAGLGLGFAIDRGINVLSGKRYNH